MAVKMWSPTGDQHIALTSGHTFVVPGDKAGIEVPQKFHREAIARGCIPVGMEPEAPEEAGGFDRVAVIKERIRGMLNSDDPTYFTADGKPSQTALSKLCGFNVDRHERDAIWKAIENDPELMSQA